MAMIFSFATRDTQLLADLGNFNSIIGAAPATYGVSTSEAATLNTTYMAFHAAMQACDPTVRNQTSVLIKNQAKEALKTLTYNLAMRIAGSSTVTDAQMLALGIKPRATPQPGPVPALWPTLTATSVTGTIVSLSIHDVGHGSRGGLPPGVIGTNLFSYVGATPPADANGWTFVGGVGRSSVDVPFDASLAPGTKVWLTGFYFNARKESGPACPPISVNLPGGAALPSGEMKIAA